MDQLRIRRALRFGVYTVVGGLVAYMLWRFDVVTLPAEGCSPLLAHGPGDRLVIDRRPGTPATGRVVLYRSPVGELLLGRVEQPPASAPATIWQACAAGALWIVTDRASCPSDDSRRFGPLPPEAVEGAIAFSLPW